MTKAAVAPPLVAASTAAWVRALFAPSAVALVGVSNDGARLAGGPLRYLRRHGFTGPVYPVNARYPAVQGEPAFRGLASLPGPVDHAYILLNTDDAISAVEACAAAGVKVATILAGGFAEAGAEGVAKQRRLLAAARAGGLRLVGPNSLGLVNLHTGLALSATPAMLAERLIPGRLMVLSQSGSMMGTLLSRGQERGIGFSKAVSVGNEADLTMGEIGEAFADDPDTAAFLLFMETIRDANAMARFAARAHALGKPIVAFKLGRSEAGQEMAVSHTGALVGSDRAADAFLRHHGIIRVDHLETLFELPALIAGRGPPRRGRREGAAVGVVTTTGGGAALVVDRLGTLGVETRAPSRETLDRLAARGVAAQAGRVLDLTMAGTRYDAMRAALETVLAAPEFDLVLSVVGSSAQFRPELAVRPIADSAAGADKPIAAFLAPSAGESLRMLAEAGIAGFRTPESCADAIAAYLDWRGPAAPVGPALTEAEIAGARAALAEAAADGGRRLNERQALALFAALGVPCAASVVMAVPGTGGDVVSPADLSYPVAAKILSRDIAHKTEAGGVALGLGGPDELVAAVRRMVEAVRHRHPGARIEGVLVQRMERGGLAEVLLGYHRDPHVGPVVTLAMGGVLAEILGDVAVRLAPVSEETARAMVEEVAGLAVIRGYRDLPRGDVAALAVAIAALSRLAGLPAVTEAEINPIVRREGEGVVAVDGLAVLGGTPPDREETR
ncbi:MAG: acetate--CoA ligase family protein [Acetobacteraceae bacterium]|nr:acetate--CoA ligase family protein [Acetobacteraceae bacterium]